MTHEALKRLREPWDAVDAMLDEGREDEAIAEARRLATAANFDDRSPLPNVLIRLLPILEKRGIRYPYEPISKAPQSIGEPTTEWGPAFPGATRHTTIIKKSTP